MGLFRRSRKPERARRDWVTVAVAQHQPEAELLANMLAEIEVPVMIRRASMDVPDMLAAGPRELLVPAEREIEARALLDPLPDEPVDDDEEDIA